MWSSKSLKCPHVTQELEPRLDTSLFYISNNCWQWC